MVYLWLNETTLWPPIQECRIVPRQAIDGLLTALHIQLHHPTFHQFKMVVTKCYLYALVMDKAIDRLTIANVIHVPPYGRHHVPASKQSASPPPDTVG